MSKYASVLLSGVTFRCDEPSHTTCLDLDNAYWSPTLSVRSRRRIAQGSACGWKIAIGSQAVCARASLRSTIETTESLLPTLTNCPSQYKCSGDMQMETGPPYRACDENVELPKPQKDVQPNYTRRRWAPTSKGSAAARRRGSRPHREGGRSGVFVDRHSGLDDEALKAFNQWRFKPGTYVGQSAVIRNYSVRPDFSGL